MSPYEFYLKAGHKVTVGNESFLVLEYDDKERTIIIVDSKTYSVICHEFHVKSLGNFLDYRYDGHLNIDKESIIVTDQNEAVLFRVGQLQKISYQDDMIAVFTCGYMNDEHGYYIDLREYDVQITPKKHKVPVWDILTLTNFPF